MEAKDDTVCLHVAREEQQCRSNMARSTVRSTAKMDGHSAVNLTNMAQCLWMMPVDCESPSLSDMIARIYHTSSFAQVFLTAWL